MKSRIVLCVTLLSVCIVGGCASYYKVTNPANNDVYYTDKLNRQDSGLVVFKDAKTGQEVTLPASEVQQISKEQYDVGRYSTTAAPTTRP